MYHCPFHEDTQPSLSIDSRKCLWHCFGCERGGAIRALGDLVGDATSEQREENVPSPTKEDWVTENPGQDWCGKARRVLYKNRTFIAVIYWCGSWRCSRCAGRYKDQWKFWLRSVSNGEMYALKLDGGQNWDTLTTRWRRGGVDYARIDDDTVITSIQVDGSERVESPREFLQATIPNVAAKKPVSTSRGWKLPEEDQVDQWEQITVTLLDDTEIRAAATAAGLEDTPLGYLIPETVDEEDAKTRFKSEIQAAERRSENGIRPSA